MFTKEITHLLSEGIVTESDIKIADESSKDSGLPIYVELSNISNVDSTELFKSVAKKRGLHFVNIRDSIIDPALFELCSEKLCQKYNMVPINKTIVNGEEKIMIATTNIDTYELSNEIGFALNKKVHIVISTPESIEAIISEMFFGDDDMDDGDDDFEFEDDDEQENEVVSVDDAKKQGNDSKIVRLVNSVIKDAIKNKVSDIHIEAQEESSIIRYRLDGVLHNKKRFNKSSHASVLSRIKILSKLDIANSRSPQDGRMKIKMNNKMFDLRVSTLPTVFGEKAVMRVLDKSALSLSMEDLGLSERDDRVLTEAISQTTGAAFVTGPTGSGKTTTLYSVLMDKNTADTNLITVEDPVEFQIKGINQVNVNNKANLGFASSLRSILRQDPDIVMVGEIRDHETAEIAFHAAQTGHLVLSTLHTNDACSTVTRLIEMEVEAAVVASSLNVVVAQRLVRRLCPECKVQTSFSEKDRKILGINVDVPIFKSKGCDHCNNIGYKGRLGVHEVLDINDNIAELVLANAPTLELERAARADGMFTLFENGIQKVLQGLTSLEEVQRNLTPPEGLNLEGRITSEGKMHPLGLTEEIGNSENKKAIIVHEDENILNMLGYIFNKNNIDTILATNARSAWQTLKNNRKIDIVISEFELDEVSGLDLLKNIRNSESLNKLKFVLMSSNKNIYSEAYKAGADNVIDTVDSMLVYYVAERLLN